MSVTLCSVLPSRVLKVHSFTAKGYANVQRKTHQCNFRSSDTVSRGDNHDELYFIDACLCSYALLTHPVYVVRDRFNHCCVQHDRRVVLLSAQSQTMKEFEASWQSQWWGSMTSELTFRNNGSWAMRPRGCNRFDIIVCSTL